MKSKHILYSFVVVLSCTTLNAKELVGKTLEKATSSKFIVFGNNDATDTWVKVKEENGIETYYMQTAKDGVFQLRIKFVNTTNDVINFVWTLNKKSDLLFNEIKNKIEPLGSIEKNETLVIPISSQESFSDFSLNINIQ